MWPVPCDGTGDELSKAAILFMESKLQCQVGLVLMSDIEVKKIHSPPDYSAQSQIVVTFSSIELRDRIKSLGKNLCGAGRNVGIQIEPPDHLRGQYQSFQRLAYQMKKKFPSLRRNIKFSDPDLALTMDVLTQPDATWRNVLYEDAKIITKKSRERSGSISVGELEDMCDLGPGAPRKRRRETLLDSESDDDNTVIDLTDVEKNMTTDKPSCVSLSFINANARSLRPKLDSLDDCFQEKRLNFATLTETWFQDGRDFLQTK